MEGNKYMMYVVDRSALALARLATAAVAEVSTAGEGPP